jgi:hypothetical protein
MVFQVRDIRGRKILERDDPEEVLHWIRTRAIGFVEVWTLSASPGELIRIENIKDFKRRAAGLSLKKKEPAGDRLQNCNKQLNLLCGNDTQNRRK